MLLSALLSLVAATSAVPSQQSIKEANDANAALVASFVCKAHATETEATEIPTNTEQRLTELQLQPPLLSYQQAMATTNPAIQSSAKARYDSAVETTAQNMLALRERSKAAPISVVTTTDFSIPAIRTDITDLPDIAGIAVALGLNETAKSNL